MENASISRRGTDEVVENDHCPRVGVEDHMHMLFPYMRMSVECFCRHPCAGPDRLPDICIGCDTDRFPIA